MSEWQIEGYIKHGDNIRRRQDEEKAKLRFELTVQSKAAQRLAASSAAAAQGLSRGVESFEGTLKRLQSDAEGRAGDPSGDLDAESHAAVRGGGGAAEHITRLEKLLPSREALDAESSAYLSRLRTRRLEEDASRKEREMRRRKVCTVSPPWPLSLHHEGRPLRIDLALPLVRR